MTLLAAVLTIFKVVFWLCLIAVAGIFLFALICETIESFRSHNRGQLKLRHKFRLRGARDIDKPACWPRPVGLWSNSRCGSG
jgi:hypothetical protein